MKNGKKLKRKPIKKVVHNVCISYRSVDGSVQTIIHQKVEDFGNLDQIKGTAEKFKEDVMQINYKNLELLNSKTEKEDQIQENLGIQQQPAPLFYIYSPLGFMPVQI